MGRGRVAATMRWLIVVALAAACGSSKSGSGSGAGTGSGTGSATGSGSATGTGSAAGAGPASGSGTVSAMRTYTLTNDDGPVTVELAVPPSWTEDTAMSTPDGPVWKVAGARHLALAAVAPMGDDEVRMRKAIRMQYGEDQSAAERADLDGGRVWMSRQEGDNLHARIFVPYPGGVVMGVAMLGPDGAGRLADVRAAFETLRVVK